MVLRTWWLSVVVLLSCQFNASLPDGTDIWCNGDADCPSGFSCKGSVGRCVRTNDIDKAAPVLVEASITQRRLRRASPIVITARANEPLQRARAVLIQLGRSRSLPTVVDQGNVKVSGLVADDDQEGSATVLLDLIDPSDNETRAINVATLELDFTPPEVASVSIVAPRSAIDGLVQVRSDESLSLRLVMREPVMGGTTLVATAEGACSASGASFALRETLGSILDFGSSAPSGTAACAYGLMLGAVTDLAGNISMPHQLAERYLVDGEAPVIAGLETGANSSDGGFASTPAFSAQPGFNQLIVRFAVSGQPAELTTRLDETELVGCRRESCSAAGDTTGCQCALQVTTALSEGPHVISVSARDIAGNVRAASVPIRFDFTAPRILADTTSSQLTPPPGCVLSSVSQAGVGSSIREIFTVDEPLREVPRLFSMPTPLVWTRISQTGSSFAFAATVPAAAVNGLQLVQARLTDALGNAADVALEVSSSGFTIDTQAPLAPPTHIDGGIWYDRRPWGLDGQPPSYTLGALAGTLEPGTTIVALDGPDFASASEIGRTTTSANGAVSISMARADRPVVYAAAIDSACNRSAVVDVKQVRWVATFGNKVAGSLLENPHLFETRPTFRFARNQADSAEVAKPSAVAFADNQTHQTKAGYQWESQELDATGPLPSNGQPLVAYDPLRQRPIATNNSGEVWEWRNPYWFKLANAVPEPRSNGSFAFDTRRNRGVFVGALGSNGAISNTWEWDGETWLFRSDAGVTDSPWLSPVCTVYDARRAVTVVLGTSSVSEWNGQTWVRRSAPNGPSSALSYWVAGAYDSERNRLIFLDSQAGATFELRDTGWASLGAGPRVKEVALAFDPNRRVIVANGTGQGTNLRETWEWDGSSWSRTQAPTYEQFSRNYTSLAYDAPSRLMLRVENGEPAVYDGSSWRLTSRGFSQPSFATAVSTSFDRRRGVVVSYTANTVSEWNGREWRTVTTSPLSPTSSALFTFDEARGETIALSNTGSSYTWQGSSWIDKTPSTGTPPSTTAGSLVYDRARNRSLLLNFAGTWSWDGNQWTSLGAGVPFIPHPQAGDMVFNPTQDRAVFFGKEGHWEYQNAAWNNVPLDGGANPTPRLRHAMAFDDSTGLVLMYGGVVWSTQRATNELWAWDGIRWTEVSPPGPKPPPRFQHRMVYDSARRRVVVVGGSEQPATSAPAPTVELLVDPRYRPGHVARIAFSSAAAADARIEAVSIDAVAGASSGVSLWTYEAEAFLPASTNNTATSTAPAAIRWSSTDTSRLAGLFTGPRQELLLALTPMNPNGTNPGTIATDTVAVTVTYQRR